MCFSLIATRAWTKHMLSPWGRWVSENLSLTLSWHKIPDKDWRGMFLEKHNRVDYTAARLSVVAVLSDKHQHVGQRHSLPPNMVKKRHVTCVKAREAKGWTCEKLIIYTLEKISTHTCSRSSVCCFVYLLFLHQRKRRGDSEMELEGEVGGSVVQEIEGERRGEKSCWQRRRGRDGTMWKNRPTVQRACIGERDDW